MINGETPFAGRLRLLDEAWGARARLYLKDEDNHVQEPWEQAGDEVWAQYKALMDTRCADLHELVDKARAIIRDKGPERGPDKHVELQAREFWGLVDDIFILAGVRQEEASS